MILAISPVAAARPLPVHPTVCLLLIGGESAAVGVAGASPVPRSAPLVAAASVVRRCMALLTTISATTLADAAPPTPMHAALLLAFVVNPSVSVTSAAAFLL